MIEIADKFMRESQPEKALKAYQAAWSKLHRQLDINQRVWLLLSIANAAVRFGDFEEAFDALLVLPEHYSNSGIVVGNPLFHLLVGLSLHGLSENSEGEADNFARALICGGPEIFVGEAPTHLKRTTEVLHPPDVNASWNGYAGCSRDLLNEATGYLRELLAEKYGSAPPYS